VKITVSYAGIDKRIPLVVTPSLELSDEQVMYAESELHRVIRHVFKIPHESLFYLHEAESGRIMSKETFREPTQLSAFPRHWYLTVENYNGTGAAVVDMEEKVGCVRVCVLPLVQSDSTSTTTLDSTCEETDTTPPLPQCSPSLSQETWGKEWGRRGRGGRPLAFFRCLCGEVTPFGFVFRILCSIISASRFVCRWLLCCIVPASWPSGGLCCALVP